MMIDHIRYVPNQQETVYRNIKEKHLPVIVYGAGELALCVTNLLKKHSISPWAYAVDAPYYEQGRFYQGKPIWRFDFLARHPDQFVFVLGIGNPTVVKSFVKRDDICGFVLLSPYGEKAPITYSYLKEHETAFQQTYDWLEDDLSRRTMLAYLNLKISGNVRYNFDVMTSGQYFCECTSDFRGGAHSSTAALATAKPWNLSLHGRRGTTRRFMRSKPIRRMPKSAGNIWRCMIVRTWRLSTVQYGINKG